MPLAVLTSARCLTEELGNLTRGNLFFSVGNRWLVISQNAWQTRARCKDSSPNCPKSVSGNPTVLWHISYGRAKQEAEM